jgi:hypothetical protein
MKHDPRTCKSSCCAPNVYVTSKVFNNTATWLYLIGTKRNAEILRARLTGLKSPPLDPMFGPEPLQCPLTVLYGAEVSRQAYANPDLRSALDAWDNGSVSPDDLRRWCLTIEKGEYVTDLSFSPRANVIYIEALRSSMAKKLADRANSRRGDGTKPKGTLDRKRLAKKSRKTPSPINWDQLDL